MRQDCAMVETWYISIFWGLVVPSQGLQLGGLLGSGSAKSGGGSNSGQGNLLGTALGGVGSLLGTGGGGLLGTVTGGDGGGGGLLGSVTGGDGGGGGLLGSVTGGDGGGGGLLGSVTGGDGGGGLLGSVTGGDGGGGGLLSTAIGGGGGLLDATGGLLGNSAGGLLGGGGQSEVGSLLGGALGGNSLLSMPGLLNGNLLGLDGLLGGKSKEPFQWYNALNLEIVRGSWKVLRSCELVLNLQARVTVNLPGALSFLSGSSVEMNLTSHLAVTQDRPGDLKLVLKNCQDLVGGFTVKLPSSLIASLINGFINTGLRTILPSMICPVFQIWFSLVNMQLHALNDYVYFGLLGKLHTALSSVPFSTGQFSEIDLKDKPFPGAFLKWLLNFVGSVTSRMSS